MDPSPVPENNAGLRTFHDRLQSEAVYRSIVEHAPVGIALRDLQGTFAATNQRYRDIIGYTQEELERLPFSAYTYPEDLEVQQRLERELLARRRDAYRLEKRYLHKDGHVVWVDVAVSLICDDRGVPSFLVGTVEDITQRKAVEEALRESQERFASAFEYGAIGKALVGLDGRWLKVNRSLCQLVGYGEDEILSLSFQDITHPDDLHTDLQYVQQMLAGEIESYQMEKRYVRKDGSLVWILLSVSLVHDAGGAPMYFIAQIQDISERKRAEEALRHLAHHDPLTGLPNRRLLTDRLVQTLAHAQRRGEVVAVLFLGLDGFKSINDRLGHDEGDRVLCVVAEQLAARLRRADTVARLGGDEFIVVLPDVGSGQNAARVAEKLLDVLRAAFGADAGSVSVGASVGISLFPFDGDTAEQLVQRADAAMYRAKQQGKGRWALYNAEVSR